MPRSVSHRVNPGLNVERRNPDFSAQRMMDRMLEHVPTDEQKQVLNQCLRCRGLIVGSYAHVEFLLADLCIKSWRLPSYRSLAKRFPYKSETRERAVSAILALGPVDSKDSLLSANQNSRLLLGRRPWV